MSTKSKIETVTLRSPTNQIFTTTKQEAERLIEKFGWRPVRPGTFEEIDDKE